MMGQTVTDSEINMYWPFLDTNQDGLISKAELTALADQNQSNQFPTGSLRVYTKTEKVNFLMNRYDTNKNGNLGFTEVRVLLADLGYSNPTNNEVYWLISLLDTNRDNKISWSELYNGLQ
jgi:Ca2+-binding EF-hand superfamily protein